MNNLSPSQRVAGVALVEFAIVLPLMLLMLFGITELGRALYQENTLTKAVNTGARYLARVPDIATFDDHTGSGNCTWSDTSAAVAEAQNLVANGSDTTPLLPGLDPDDDVEVDFEYSTITKYGNIPVQICIVRVSAAVPFAGLFGEIVVPFTNLGSITLNAVAEERYIGL